MLSLLIGVLLVIGIICGFYGVTSLLWARKQDQRRCQSCRRLYPGLFCADCSGAD